MKFSSETHLASFVERALGAVRSEVGWAYALLVERLGELVVDVEVDGERVRVSKDAAELRVSTDGAPGDVVCTLSRATIRALVQGRTTL